MCSEQARVDDACNSESSSHDGTDGGEKMIEWLVLQTVLDCYWSELVLEPNCRQHSHSVRVHFERLKQTSYNSLTSLSCSETN